MHVSSKTKLRTLSDVLCDYRTQSSDIIGSVDKFWKTQNANINKMVSILEKSQGGSL